VQATTDKDGHLPLTAGATTLSPIFSCLVAPRDQSPHPAAGLASRKIGQQQRQLLLLGYSGAQRMAMSWPTILQPAQRGQLRSAVTHALRAGVFSGAYTQLEHAGCPIAVCPGGQAVKISGWPSGWAGLRLTPAAWDLRPSLPTRWNQARAGVQVSLSEDAAGMATRRRVGGPFLRSLPHSSLGPLLLVTLPSRPGPERESRAADEGWHLATRDPRAGSSADGPLPGIEKSPGRRRLPKGIGP